MKDETGARANLAWVQDELGESLTRIRVLVEQHMGAPDKQLPLQQAVVELQQARGTARMVQCTGIAVLCEEMRATVSDLMQGRVGEPDVAYAALLGASMQLSDYLDIIASGEEDSALVFQPVINELRVARGQGLMTESELFAHQMRGSESELELSAPEGRPPGAVEAAARKFIKVFQHSLLSWLRDQDTQLALGRLGKIAEQLAAAATTRPVYLLWRTVAAAVEAMLTRGLGDTPEIKRLLGRVGSQLKVMAEKGESGSLEQVGLLPWQLLFHVGRGASQGPRVRALREAFNLERRLPSAALVEALRQKMRGPNTQLLEKLSGEIRKDLAEVKDVIDLVVRAGDKAPVDLPGTEQHLKRIGGTLDMLGLTPLQRVIENQAHRLGQLDGRPPADDPLWLEVATALLRVEHSLDDALVRHLRQAAGAPEKAVDIGGGVPQREVDAGQSALVREIKADIAGVKLRTNVFLEGGDTTGLGEAARLLAECQAALNVMGVERAAELTGQLSNFVQSDRFPTIRKKWRLAECFADAVACIEYFAEGRLRSDPGGNAILDDLERYVENLEIPQSPQSFQDTATFRAPPPASPEPEAPAAGAEAPASSAADVAPEVDPEIRDVFIEEASEVRERLDDLLPKFRKDAGDAAVSGEVRRAFHTLKGSGRMVGADLLGEFSWAAENLLNQCLSGVLPADARVVDLVTGAVERLPALMTAFESGGATPDDTEDFVQDLHRAARGDGPKPEPGILEAFHQDASERLGVIRDWLGGLNRDLEFHPADDDVNRAFHTLRGSASLAQATTLSDIAGAAEDWLDALRGAGRPLNPAGLALLDELFPALEDWVERVARGDARTPDPKPWMRRLSEALGAVPCAVDDGEVERRATFSLDAFAQLEQAEAVLATWRRQPDATSSAAKVAAEFQRLRGDAATAGCGPLSRVAAASETAFVAVGDSGRAPPAAFFDAATALVEAMYQQLDGFREGPLHDDGAHWVAQAGALVDLAAAPDDAGQVRPESQPEADEGEADQVVEVGPVAGDEDDPGAKDAPPEPLPEADEVEADEVVEVPPVAEDEDDPGAKDAPPETLPEADEMEAEEVVEVPPVAEDEDATDPELSEIFRAEAEELLEELDRQLDRWERLPSAGEPMAEIARVLHTLKGGARTAGAAPLGDVAHRFESALEMVERGSILRDAQLFVGLHHVADHLHTMVDALRGGHHGDAGPALDVLDGLPVAQSDAVQPAAESGAPPPTDPGEGAVSLDSELVETFRGESAELNESLGALLKRWDAEGAGNEVVQGVLRDLHTLKGGARMAGLARMGDAAHEMESLVEKAAQEGATHDGVLLGRVQAMAEELQRMQDQLERGNARALAAPSATVPSRPEATMPGDATAQAATAESGTLRWAEGLFWQPGGDDAAAAVARRETARVAVEQLDQMLNEAGEISIFRSRIEQHSSALSFQLEDMVETISRVREQLRAMDIETEAQIAARGFSQGMDVEREGYAEFDPLEMDRYSRMQELSRALTESVGDLSALHHTMDEQLSETNTLLMQQGRVNTEVQHGLMGTLMVPFSRQTQRLQRVVRQAADDEGKAAELTFEGVEQEMDRKVLERIVAPLEHLLRNAVVHGIESPRERSRRKKSKSGRIEVRLSRVGSQLVIEIRDDGGGLDHAAIRKTAVKRGLMPAQAKLSDDEIAMFIFEPGFSTAKALTQAAGRGVGMDVVASEVKQLGGTLELGSEKGHGTRFTIRLPLTLSLTQALLVGVGEETFAISLPSIENIVRIPRAQLDEYLGPDGPPFTYGGHPHQVQRLADFLDVSEAAAEAEETRTVPAVLVRLSEGLGGVDRRAAVVVDRLIGNREIVTKPVGPQVSTVQGISGATILPNGTVVLILDLPQLIADRARREAVSQAADSVVTAAPSGDTRTQVMVVDDSITIRRVTERLLERNGFRPVLAKDGLDAIAMLQTETPDAVLLDIEMPRADGFEVASFIRNHERIADVPIIMITSRSGDKHRERARRIGVNRYMIKPFQEDALMVELRDVLAVSA